MSALVFARDGWQAALQQAKRLEQQNAELIQELHASQSENERLMRTLRAWQSREQSLRNSSQFVASVLNRLVNKLYLDAIEASRTPRSQQTRPLGEEDRCSEAAELVWDEDIVVRSDELTCLLITATERLRQVVHQASRHRSQQSHEDTRISATNIHLPPPSSPPSLPSPPSPQRSRLIPPPSQVPRDTAINSSMGASMAMSESALSSAGDAKQAASETSTTKRRKKSVAATTTTTTAAKKTKKIKKTKGSGDATSQRSASAPPSQPSQGPAAAKGGAESAETKPRRSSATPTTLLSTSALSEQTKAKLNKSQSSAISVHSQSTLRGRAKSKAKM